MPVKKSATDDCCAKCTSDIDALKKEIAQLKKSLAAVKKSSGGKDSRVDRLVEILKLSLTDGLPKAERIKCGDKRLELIKGL